MTNLKICERHQKIRISKMDLYKTSQDVYKRNFTAIERKVVRKICNIHAFEGGS